MCGICGIIGNENQTAAMGQVQRMMQAMMHRGPDGEGLFAAGGAAFGMRRLSIIDLAGGQQPTWNESGTLAVVFNGEIYNFRELRRSLEGHGHAFSTQSDTETLVHAYETWGADCVRHLRGMFAFAVMELPDGKMNRARRVFLARDRMGIKPLYYAFAGGDFLFASEVRALLASDCIPRQLSSSSISSYLLFGSVCEPMTLIEGIRSLPPGYCGYVSADAPTRFEPKPYWTVSDAAQSSEMHSAGSGAEHIRAALEDSVRCHLISDVPLGVFLSSGIDSTALAAIASKQCARIKTFTVVFSEQEFSEAELARSTADRLGTEHSELLLTGEEMRVRLDEAIAGFDQPSADGMNTYFISWAARQACLKVALSGLGSDEIFGGYSTFRATAQISRLMASARFSPEFLRKMAVRVGLWGAPNGMSPDRIRKASSAFTQPTDLPHPYYFTRTLFVPEAAGEMLRTSPDTWKNSPWWQWLSKAAEDTAQLDRFTAVSWLENRSYLVSMLLRDTDTMSMCHSLEVRVPFLDDALLTMALSCPESAKDKKGVRKSLLIEALGDLIPANIVQQPKRTFTLPWEVWLRGPLRQQVQSSLSNCDPCLASIIDTSEVTKIWEGFLAGRTSWSRPWSIFVLNEWVTRNLTSASNVLASASDGKAAAPALR